jgi:predicted AAA+ superfamily ATPase
MQATIKIKESEFDYSFFKKLKTLFKGGEIEILGSTTDENAVYWESLNKAIDDVENKRNLIRFSGEEFEALVANLTHA